MNRRSVTFALTLVIVATAWPGDTWADKDFRDQAKAAIHSGIAYLRTTQNDDGSWSPDPGPAITAMVVAVMLDQNDIAPDDPAITKAIEYILSKVQDDGAIHDGILENYNTAICITALTRVSNNPHATKAIEGGQAFLKGQQWSGQVDPQGVVVGETHAYYGGAGYGKHGRPDLSNTQVMLEGLYQSGLDCDDPAFVRAMAFISKCQGTAANTEFGDQIAPDGGAIYSTSIDKNHIGQPQSKAGKYIAEDGTTRLRTYGSMTYAMFKSYIYARLDRNDVRVTDALKWAQNNYTVEVNPGMPEDRQMQGYYYYLLAFSRALDAWGEAVIVDADGAEHRWAEDLIGQLVKLQSDEGWWINETDRWYEGDKNLVTAYALTAIGCGLR